MCYAKTYPSLIKWSSCVLSVAHIYSFQQMEAKVSPKPKNPKPSPVSTAPSPRPWGSPCCTPSESPPRTRSRSRPRSGARPRRWGTPHPKRRWPFGKKIDGGKWNKPPSKPVEPICLQPNSPIKRTPNDPKRPENRPQRAFFGCRGKRGENGETVGSEVFGFPSRRFGVVVVSQR